MSLKEYALFKGLDEKEKIYSDQFEAHAVHMNEHALMHCNFNM